MSHERLGVDTDDKCFVVLFQLPYFWKSQVSPTLSRFIVFQN